MYQSRTSSQPFTPHHYNYHDYMAAWFMTFYIRYFDHSCFFHFHNNIRKDFPMWFQEWFDIFSHVPKILLEPVHDGFILFASYVPQETGFNSNEVFKIFTTFSIP